MLKRILVPLDGSKSGEVVLPLLQQMPLPAGTRLLLAKIVELGSKDPGPGFVEESLPLAEAYLRQAASRLARGGVQVETFVRRDRIAEALVSLAVEQRASLIAMATHGGIASPASPFGGIAEQLIRTSPVPVLAVPSLSPSAVPERGIQTILVTSDGSDYADAIAPYAADLAGACGSAVILLELTSGAGNESRASLEQEAAAEHLKGLARVFEERGISTEGVTGRGSPVNGILNLVRSRKVDVIAMSTHGGARRCDAVVGSVTQAVLQQAGLPVLMTRSCPAPERPGERRGVAKARPR